MRAFIRWVLFCLLCYCLIKSFLALWRLPLLWLSVVQFPPCSHYFVLSEFKEVELGYCVNLLAVNYQLVWGLLTTIGWLSYFPFYFLIVWWEIYLIDVIFVFIFLQSRESCAAAKGLFIGHCWTPVDLQTQLLPYLAIINIPLKNPGKNQNDLIFCSTSQSINPLGYKHCALR